MKLSNFQTFRLSDLCSEERVSGDETTGIKGSLDPCVKIEIKLANKQLAIQNSSSVKKNLEKKKKKQKTYNTLFDPNNHPFITSPYQSYVQSLPKQLKPVSHLLTTSIDNCTIGA